MLCKLDNKFFISCKITGDHQRQRDLLEARTNEAWADEGLF